MLSALGGGGGGGFLLSEPYTLLAAPVESTGANHQISNHQIC